MKTPQLTSDLVLKDFLSKFRSKKGHMLLFKFVLEVLARTIKHERRGIQMEKKGVKWSQ